MSGLAGRSPDIRPWHMSPIGGLPTVAIELPSVVRSSPKRRRSEEFVIDAEAHDIVFFALHGARQAARARNTGFCRSVGVRDRVVLIAELGIQIFSFHAPDGRKFPLDARSGRPTYGRMGR